jgi:hypothetical protein
VAATFKEMDDMDQFGPIRVVIDVIPDERQGASPDSTRVQVTGAYDYDGPLPAEPENVIARNVMSLFLGHDMHLDAISGLLVPPESRS